jgi:hypothetical protein
MPGDAAFGERLRRLAGRGKKYFAASPEATKSLAGLVERYTDRFPLWRRWGRDGSSVQVFESLLPVRAGTQCENNPRSRAKAGQVERRGKSR